MYSLPLLDKKRYEKKIKDIVLQKQLRLTN